VSGTQSFPNAAAGREADREVVKSAARHVHLVCPVNLKRDLLENTFLFIC
jgi:hypothetical protein